MPRPLTPVHDPVRRTGRRAPRPAVGSVAAGAIIDTRDTAAGTGTAYAVYDCHTLFEYTGAVQTYTVSAGVTSITVEAAGAQGAGGGNSPGGKGGSITGIFTVVPGTTYDVYVGGQGTYPTGGWPNGGRGVTANNQGKGGGGATYLVPQGGSIADALIVGGAGGGGSDTFYAAGAGGYGGYPAGGDGAGSGIGCPGGNAGSGATQSAPGDGGCSDEAGDTDGLGQGGDGGSYGAVAKAEGGGGGGGWHGGGSGTVDAAAGGGGSSYVDTGSGTLDSYTNDTKTGNGSVRISEPGGCDPVLYDWDYSDASSITTDGNGLSLILDQIVQKPIGNAYIANGRSMAPYPAGTQNGLNYANSGSSPFQGVSAITQSQPWGLEIVWNPKSSLSYTLGFASQSVSLYRWNGDLWVQSPTGVNVGAWATGWHVLYVQYDGASTKVYRNGTLMATVNAGTNSPAGVGQVWNNSAGTNTNDNFDVGQMRLWPGFKTGDQIAASAAALMAKWGIA